MADKKVERCKALINEGLSGDALIGALCEEFGISAFAADWVRKDAERVEVSDTGGQYDISINGREDHLLARMKIVERALKVGNEELALKALKDLAELQNTYNEVEDKSLVIEFKFPEPNGYKPLTREIMNKAMEMLNASETAV